MVKHEASPPPTSEQKTQVVKPRAATRGDRAQWARMPNGKNGSNAEWENWTWWEPIRTISEVPLEFTIPVTKTFLFQSLSDAARQLKEKGLSYLAISKILEIDDKTVKKAITKGKKLILAVLLPFLKPP